tara:strand:- start:2274 stop:2726 length:453 start_codon:yes stop_codon:yes gene_type:complete
MKKVRFILIGALTVLIVQILVVSISSCTKVSSNDNVGGEQMLVGFDSNTTPIIVEELGMVDVHHVHSLKKDGVEYLVIGRYNGGAAIIKHEPIVQRKFSKLNMDSVVTYGVWLDEYSMLGYTQAKPSKESLESLTNPEVRPVPVSSEKSL